MQEDDHPRWFPRDKARASERNLRGARHVGQEPLRTANALTVAKKGGPSQSNSLRVRDVHWHEVTSVLRLATMPNFNYEFCSGDHGMDCAEFFLIRCVNFVRTSCNNLRCSPTGSVTCFGADTSSVACFAPWQAYGHDGQDGLSALLSHSFSLAPWLPGFSVHKLESILEAVPHNFTLRRCRTCRHRKVEETILATMESSAFLKSSWNVCCHPCRPNSQRYGAQWDTSTSTTDITIFQVHTDHDVWHHRPAKICTCLCRCRRRARPFTPRPLMWATHSDMCSS